MSLFFVSGSSQYCVAGGPINFSYGRAFSVWVKRAASGGSGSGALMNSGTSGSVDHRNWLAINSSGRAICGSRTTVQTAISGTTVLPTDQWFNLIGLFHTAAFRSLSYNGAAESSNGTSRATNAPNIFYIGCDPDLSNFFNGYITHASVWSYVDIDDFIDLRSQIQTTPTMDITAGTLLHYWPDLQEDQVGSVDLTPTNSPTVSSDEPAIFASSGLTSVFSSAVFQNKVFK